MLKIIKLDGNSLSIEDCILIACGYNDAGGGHRYPEVRLSDDARGRMDEFNAAFDSRIHEARNHLGQVAVAVYVRELTRVSVRMTHDCQVMKLPQETKKLSPDGRPIPRIKDAYSFRCHAQVSGAVRRAVDFVWRVVEHEINASTDNPLVFAMFLGVIFLWLDCFCRHWPICHFKLTNVN